MNIPLPPKAPLGKVIPRRKPAKVQHTPGPWYTGYGADAPKHAVVCKTYPYVICEVPEYVNHDDEGEREANARLIAAAPELLDACKTALGYMERRCDICQKSEMEQVKAALAKATTA